MRKVLFAALAAAVLLCPRPAAAQLQTIPYLSVPSASGTLTTVTTDTVTVPISGAQWATATITVATAGTATVTAQVRVNGQWVPSAYATRTSTTAANPTTQAISATTVTGADVWEVPLPSNATGFRLLCGGTGTTTTVQLGGGQAYVPGAPVLAVLYDVTSGTAAALDTGTVDVSGWGALTHDFTMSSGTPAFSYAEVDDAGATLANITTGTAAFMGGFGPGATLGGTAGIAAATASLPLPRRVRYQSAAITSQTSRIRLVARR